MTALHFEWDLPDLYGCPSLYIFWKTQRYGVGENAGGGVGITHCRAARSK